jgi:hypothetical protein
LSRVTAPTRQTTADEQAETDAQRGENGVREAQEPPGNLDLLGDADPETEPGRDDEQPPPSDDETEGETSADEHEVEHASIIGRLTLLLKNGGKPNRPPR